MELLAIYLQDHLALSLGGIRLARRCRAENPTGPLAAFLDRLVPELEEDRQAVRDALRAAGGAPSAVKEAAAVLGEWAGRLKPNGRVVGYSALSRVWELEALLAGSSSRRALWAALARLARRVPALRAVDAASLEQRAAGHVEELERHRLRAAEEAFAGATRRARRGSAAAQTP